MILSNKQKKLAWIPLAKEMYFKDIRGLRRIDGWLENAWKAQALKRAE